MHRIPFYVLIVFFSGLAGAATPVLPDRELFFGEPEISGAQISPDGKYVAFLKPYQGTRNIWVKKTAEPASAARAITGGTPQPVSSFIWSRNSQYIVFLQDARGDGAAQIYAVDPAQAPPTDAPVPAARNLTNAAGARAVIFARPRIDADTLYIGLNDRDAAWHDLYLLRLSTGERTLVRKNTERIGGWIFDHRDKLRLAVRSNDKGDTETLRVEDTGYSVVYSCDVFETCAPARFTRDNQRVWFLTNKGAGTDLLQLTQLDLQTGKTEIMESDPLKRVDFGSAFFSERTDELLATFYADERTRVYWKDKSFEADYKFLKSKLGDKEIAFGSHTEDERLFLVSVSGDTEPGETYLFNRQTRQLTRQFRSRARLPREALSPMQALRYKSSDGLEIPAYLTLPKGLPGKNLPLVVLPHGGPWARDTWGYRGVTQFLASRGYAVLSPNYRGSTGYGKKFLNLGDGEWGGRMQDDITWGVKEVVAQGIADPRRVGILGVSYGGYAALAGAAFTPGVYAAAVAISAPSNLFTLLDAVPPYMEVVRKTMYRRLADPATPEGKALLTQRSPLFSSEKIRTPLLVAQGANDQRVKKTEADQLVVALRDRGVPVEYLVAPDEGHGFTRPVNNLALYTAAEKFLAKHLGGRSQASTTPAVAKRLREITVAARTVVLPRKVDAAAAKPARAAAPLQPGTYKYAVTLQMGEHSAKLDQIILITDEAGRWNIVETTTMPDGQVTDTGVYEKGTLAPVSRSLQQGGVTVNLTFKGNQARGTVKAGEQEKTVSVSAEGALFAEGPGARLMIGTLPLAEGYLATFYNLDLQLMKSKLNQVRVVGSETVKVPAGTVDAWRVEISPADGAGDKLTLWVGKQNRKTVKMEAVLPQMNGAKMTAELQ